MQLWLFIVSIPQIHNFPKLSWNLYHISAPIIKCLKDDQWLIHSSDFTECWDQKNIGREFMAQNQKVIIFMIYCNCSQSDMWGAARLPNKTKTKKDKCDRACLAIVFTSTTMVNAETTVCCAFQNISIWQYWAKQVKTKMCHCTFFLWKYQFMCGKRRLHVFLCLHIIF